MATVTVGQWGNANALRLPRAVCKEMGITAGSTLTVEVQNGRIVIEPADNRYTLRGRMKGWDGERLHMEELDWGAPQGDEIW